MRPTTTSALIWIINSNWATVPSLVIIFLFFLMRKIPSHKIRIFIWWLIILSRWVLATTTAISRACMERQSRFFPDRLTVIYLGSSRRGKRGTHEIIANLLPVRHCLLVVHIRAFITRHLKDVKDACCFRACTSYATSSFSGWAGTWFNYGFAFEMM